MKKIILLIIIMFSFILGQTCSDGVGFDDDDFCVEGKITTDELEVLGGTPGVGKVLTDDGTGAGIAIWTASVAGFADPMTTRGDIIYRDATNVTARLGLGANTFVLGSDGTDALWTDLSGTYQPLDPALTNISGLVYVSPSFIKLTADDTYAVRTLAEVRTDLGLVIGTNIQAWDADLDTWALVTPSANGQSLVASATYASMRGLLDLEAGTDFYSISASDAAHEAELNNSAGLAAALDDETGTLLSVFSDSPTFTTDIEVRKDGIGTSQLDTYGLLLSNTTAATALDPIQYSPPLLFQGYGWKTDVTAASQKSEFRIWNKPAEGTAAPTGNLLFQSSIADGAYSDLMTITSGGNVGIGTTSPDEILHISAAVPKIKITDTGASAGYMIMRGANSRFAFDLDPDNAVAVSDFQFLTDGTEKLRILANGNVGIGTTAPGNPLAVNRAADGVIVDFESGDVVEGNVSIAGNTTSYNAFVGSHYTQLKAGQTEPPIGAVVVSTGEIIPSYYEKKSKTEINKKDAYTFFNNLKKGVVKEDSLYFRHDTVNVNMPNKEYFVYVSSTSTVGDKRVYGTWLGKMSDDAKNMSFGEPNKPVYLVAQVGLYKILVTEDGGNISNGDYLETSIHPYLAQKQASSYRSNSTIAKSMINVDWSTEKINLEFGVKVKLIPITF